MAKGNIGIGCGVAACPDKAGAAVAATVSAASGDNGEADGEAMIPDAEAATRGVSARETEAEAVDSGRWAMG